MLKQRPVAACFMFATALCTGPIACTTIPEFPATLSVATSGTVRADAAAGTGPTTLADSTWSVARVADPAETDPPASPPPGPYGGLLTGQGLARPPVGERIFLIEFGDNGRMTRVTENRFFLAEIYGADIPVGGEWSSATIPGIAYRSASYGVQSGDRFGVAVLVHVRFLHIFLGQATLYAWGSVDGNAIDGVLGYVLDFTDGAVPILGTVADQYPVEGTRVLP